MLGNETFITGARVYHTSVTCKAPGRATLPQVRQLTLLERMDRVSSQVLAELILQSGDLEK